MVVSGDDEWRLLHQPVANRRQCLPVSCADYRMTHLEAMQSMEKAFALLVFGNGKKELDDPRAVAIVLEGAGLLLFRFLLQT